MRKRANELPYYNRSIISFNNEENQIIVLTIWGKKIGSILEFDKPKQNTRTCNVCKNSIFSRMIIDINSHCFFPFSALHWMIEYNNPVDINWLKCVQQVWRDVMSFAIFSTEANYFWTSYRKWFGCRLFELAIF